MLVCCSVLLVNAALSAPQNEVNAPAFPEAVAPLKATPQFFVDHPDLDDEREAVDVASHQLTEEGVPAGDSREAGEMLAARTRALLSQRTPEEWKKQAIRLYPDLGMAGSEFNSLFVRYYRELQELTPGFTEEPSWPVLLAKRCADELRHRKPSSTSPPPAASPELLHPPSTAPASQGQIGRLGLCLMGAPLIGAALLPSVLAFRRRRTVATADIRHGPHASSPYRRALKPAMLVYSAVASVAVLRSLPENADLSVTNRVFVTFLVSIVAGGCAGMIGYLFALLYCALHRRDGL